MYARWCGFALWLLLYGRWCVAADDNIPKCPATAEEKGLCELKEPSSYQQEHEYIYNIEGEDLMVRLSKVDFAMTCNNKTTLDNPALPRLTKLTYFNKVTLTNCTSQNYSYNDALLMLNVSISNEFSIKSSGDIITSNHLAGLPDMDKLEFSHLKLSADALKSLHHVGKLYFENMHPPPMNHLPNSVSELELVNPGTLILQDGNFTNLPKKMETLIIRDEAANVSVKAAVPLRELTLTAEFVFLNAELPKTLKEVYLFNWGETEPEPWQSCCMTSLIVNGAKAKLLPDNWLVNCSTLSQLQLNNAPDLTTLAKSAFRGARALKFLALTGSSLQELPAELLHDATNLQILDLSYNDLHVLEGQFFVKNSKSLQQLYLSSNKLTKEVFASVSSVKSLRILDLGKNIMLLREPDTCQHLPLKGLNNLAKLLLDNTGAQRICHNWRQDLESLEYFNFSSNNITKLMYADLEFSTNVTVDLTKNNVKHLIYSSYEYTDLRDKKHCKFDRIGAHKIELSSTLQCGCTESWAALALQTCPAHVKLDGARCPGNINLSAIPLDNLTCPVEEGYCPSPCHCAKFLRAEMPRTVIRVICERANLTQLPVLPNASVAWELHLAHNHIKIPDAKMLPPNVVELDLRYNGLTQVNVAASLLANKQIKKLYFSGSRLDCACGTERALADLEGNSSRIGDFRNLLCIDGAKPSAARVNADCGRNFKLTLAVILVPLLMAVVMAIGCLAWPTSRAWVIMILRDWGLIPRPPEPYDSQPIDVFVSFSHLDFIPYVKAIKTWLESGSQPYKTIIHYRDWVPGGWIPAQIEASVRLSQRTLAIVSSNFINSTWAPAEFREAYAAAMRGNQPRLVVILLEDLENLPLNNSNNAVLQRYLASNTYLRWGEFCFWTKLRAALPPPRGCAQPKPNKFWTKFCTILRGPCHRTRSDTECELDFLEQSPMVAQPSQKSVVQMIAREMQEPTHRKEDQRTIS